MNPISQNEPPLGLGSPAFNRIKVNSNMYTHGPYISLWCGRFQTAFCRKRDLGNVKKKIIMQNQTDQIIIFELSFFEYFMKSKQFS